MVSIKGYKLYCETTGEKRTTKRGRRLENGGKNVKVKNRRTLLQLPSPSPPESSSQTTNQVRHMNSHYIDHEANPVVQKYPLPFIFPFHPPAKLFERHWDHFCISSQKLGPPLRRLISYSLLNRYSRTLRIVRRHTVHNIRGPRTRTRCRVLSSSILEVVDERPIWRRGRNWWCTRGVKPWSWVEVRLEVRLVVLLRHHDGDVQGYGARKGFRPGREWLPGRGRQCEIGKWIVGPIVLVGLKDFGPGSLTCRFRSIAAISWRLLLLIVSFSSLQFYGTVRTDTTVRVVGTVFVDVLRWAHPATAISQTDRRSSSPGFGVGAESGNNLCAFVVLAWAPAVYCDKTHIDFLFGVLWGWVCWWWSLDLGCQRLTLFVTSPLRRRRSNGALQVLASFFPSLFFSLPWDTKVGK